MTTARLRKRKPAIRMGASIKQGNPLSPTEKEPDLTTYSGRVAAVVRSVRRKRKLSVVEFQTALASHGVNLSAPAIYAYENGNRQINPDHYPALAKALGFKSVRDFLPAK